MLCVTPQCIVELQACRAIALRDGTNLPMFLNKLSSLWHNGRGRPVVLWILNLADSIFWRTKSSLLLAQRAARSWRQLVCFNSSPGHIQQWWAGQDVLRISQLEDLRHYEHSGDKRSQQVIPCDKTQRCPEDKVPLANKMRIYVQSVHWLGTSELDPALTFNRSLR
jgi:hypothetical protein